MKHFCYFFVWLLFPMAMTMNAQQPEWVRTHPVSEDSYIGIGMAPITQQDYVAKATQSALADIAGQISSRVETNSFMHTIDVDGKSRELFEEKVNLGITSYLEGQKLVDSYSDERNYYVYYSLDKKAYVATLEKHCLKAATKGYDYYVKGEEALAANSLSNAAQLFAKGLEVVEPWLFTDVYFFDNGRKVDVPSVLYQAYINVFDGLAITVNETNVSGESFKAIKEPIAACLSRNGVVVPNVKLKAEFLVGSGAVTPAMETDFNGTAEFYVTNITSKEPVQEMRIGIDDSFVSLLPSSYRLLLNNQTWPSAKVTISLASQPLTAYIHVSKDELSSCRKQVATLLTNQHFVITEDPDAADCFIDMATTLELGGVVKGELYDLNECLCSFEMKVYNNRTQVMLLNYTIDRQRVLAPINKGVEQIEVMCVREIMKRAKRELPQKMKSLNLN